MESTLLYKMTIWAGPTYDDVGGRGVLTIEAYFKVALWGSVHENRNEYLPSIAIPFFQDWVAQHFGLLVPESEIKVRFQPERPAETEDEAITVDFRVFTFRGDRRYAESYPQETISLDQEDSEYDPDEEYSDDEDWDDDSDDNEEW